MKAAENKPYIIHHCKNTKVFTKVGKEKIYKCNNAWLDVDRFNSRKPPTWKLCQECAGCEFDTQRPRAVNKELAERLKQAKEAKKALVN